MLTNIYFLPNNVPCPNCSTRILMTELQRRALSYETFTCPSCKQERLIKVYLNGYVGVIKDVEVYE